MNQFYLNVEQDDGTVKPQLMRDFLLDAKDNPKFQVPPYQKFFEDYIEVVSVEGQTQQLINFKTNSDIGIIGENNPVSIKTFFELFIFNKVDDLKLKKELIDAAFKELHQGGILYSVTTAVSADSAKIVTKAHDRREGLKKKLLAELKTNEITMTQMDVENRIQQIMPPKLVELQPVAETKIIFTPTNYGVSVTEEATYLKPKKYIEGMALDPVEDARGRSAPDTLAHIKCEKTFEANYYDENKKVIDVNVTIKGLEVKANPIPWNKLFDKRSLYQKIKDGMRNLINKLPSNKPNENTSEEPRRPRP